MFHEYSPSSMFGLKTWLSVAPMIDAVFALQGEHPDKFCLALFGDTMQRIYADGKVGLEHAVPADWEKPALVVNHRCPKRIVTLLNQIRAEADGAQQEPRQDAQEGVVRLFLINDADDSTNRREPSLVRRVQLKDLTGLPLLSTFLNASVSFFELLSSSDWR